MVADRKKHLGPPAAVPAQRRPTGWSPAHTKRTLSTAATGSLLVTILLVGDHRWWFRLLVGLGIVVILAALVADLRDYRAGRRSGHD